MEVTTLARVTQELYRYIAGKGGKAGPKGVDSIIGSTGVKDIAREIVSGLQSSS